MRFYVCLMFHYTDIFLFPDIHPCSVSFSLFLSHLILYVCANFVRSTSTLRKFSYEAKKNIGLHEAYDIIKIFCSVGEKRQEGYTEKKFDTFAKGTEWLHKSHKFKAPYEKETFRTMTSIKYWLNFHWCDENEIIDLMLVTTIKL